MTHRDDGSGAAEPTLDASRTCAGCRRAASPGELLRLHVVAGDSPELIPDPQRKLGGRGVSVHPNGECVRLAAEKGGFARALKQAIRVDAQVLAQTASALYVRRAESLLLAANRAKKLVIGTEAVRASIRANELQVLLFAADAEGRREELTMMAERLDRRAVMFGTKESIGRLFGREEVAVLGILDRGIGDEVVRAAAHASRLLAEAE